MKPLERLRSWSWKKRIALGGLTGLGLLLLLLVLGYVLTSVPQPSKISTNQATKILWASKTPMGTIGTNRTIVDIKDVSKDAQHAVLAAEDRDFYTEPGISPKGIARALFANVKAGGTTQGGSTITQQYAKNAFLTSERTYSRKIKEVFISIKMSQTVPKDTILQDYLNTIYFGRGAYGIDAAATTYFGRGVTAKTLTYQQAAVLASSIRSPAGYDPIKHPEAARQRWDYVLKGMKDKGWITEEQRASATYPTVQKASTSSQFPGSLDYIRDQVIAELATHNISEDQIAAGGLVVQTTLDKNAQMAAEAAVQDKIAAPDAAAKNFPVGALVSIQPGTGRVRAYYGGRDAGGFDYASHSPGVQPGSSMKPYVLATALEEGKSLATRYDGSSPQAICGDPSVSNDSGDPPFGQIDLATALAHSVNTVYVRLACDVGPSKVRDLAYKAGISHSQPLNGNAASPNSQIALGSGGYEIRPIDQADGYATFAAQGVHAAPFFVESVTKDGNKIYSVKVKTDRAFSGDIASNVVSAMQKVVTEGTATRAQLAGGRPAAGKTGTTSSNTNAWFAGFTPQLTTAVWIGMAHGGTIKNVSGVNGSVYGGTAPAQIFKDYMDKALEGQKVEDFPPAANVGSSSSSSSGGTATSPVVTATATPTQTTSSGATPVVTVTKPPVEVPTSAPPVVATSAPPSPPPSEPPPSQGPSPASSP